MFRRTRRAPEAPTTRAAVAAFFAPTSLETLVTAARVFPGDARPDLQRALDTIAATEVSVAQLIGVHSQYGSHETTTIAEVVRTGHSPMIVGPLRYDEVDVGDDEPARCLTRALWLAEAKGTRFAMLLAPNVRYGQGAGIHLEIAVPPGADGLALVSRIFERVAGLVREGGSYRGKVLSFEGGGDYDGRSGTVKVHRLGAVPREHVILPAATLRLLERNVHDFIAQREGLRALGMPVKKGLLLYGPPGTGKTHTIRYLASQLPGHTTLLVTAEQVCYLADYFRLARFLQPALLVIEDVDLIARAREEMRGPGEESLLNRLLNEMDGLREDAEILFLLTTNRPAQIEPALASRPGRVDQAIEFPLPDEAGRAKLVALYARGFALSKDLVDVVVRKTEGASAAFIKELMRRCAQHHLASGATEAPTVAIVEGALDEMLFSGGRLNAQLLGGPGGGQV
jgi:hypothetical protein